MSLSDAFLKLLTKVEETARAHDAVVEKINDTQDYKSYQKQFDETDRAERKANRELQNYKGK